MASEDASAVASLHSLPTELQLMIMNLLPDIISFRNFIHAVPMAAHTFAAYSTEMISNILANCLSRDCQKLLFVLISVQDHMPLSDRDVPFVLGTNIIYNPKICRFRLSSEPKNPIKILDYLCRTIKAVSFFTSLFPELQAYRHADFHDRHLSVLELQRLQRSLLRFEICSVLACSSPLRDAEFPPSDANPTRGHLLSAFLGKYTPWEIEELACVYDFLELAIFQYPYGKPAFPGLRTATHNEDQSRTTSTASANTIITGSNMGSGITSSRITFSEIWGPRLWQCKTLRFPASALSRRPAATNGRFYPEDELETYKAATRAKILSLGLPFLASFQQRPLAEREEKEAMMYGLGRGTDDFIHAAIFRRTDGWMKYTWFSERIYTSLTEGYGDDDNDSKGADEATQMWKYYAKDGSGNWGGAYLNLYKYRSWGYGIWDNPLEKCRNAT